MTTLAFDGRMGASGDMLLGALLAAGADRSALSPVEDALDIRYEARQVTRCGISATAVDVLLDQDEGSPDGDAHDEDSDGHGHDEVHAHDHSHGDETDHEHSHDDETDHGHSHDEEKNHEHAHDEEENHEHAEGSGPHRSYPEVVDIVESMGLPAAVENDALAIFELLGEAEAGIHGTDLSETHFHEVGADDAIADVVGVSLLVADLDPDRVVTTPVGTGGGEVEMSHGVYPVPAPAVVELAEHADWALQGGPVETELLTPTGAAVLTHYAAGVDSLPSLDVSQAGYGAGAKSVESHPNVLRAMVGTASGGLNREAVTVLETNLDDATPETLGSLQETLPAAGALDVTIIPTTMKKSRPGHLVKVIVKPEDARQVARKLAAETGTLGVREHGSGHRFVAGRDRETVAVPVDGETYDVTVKIGIFDADGEGHVFDLSAEYDDALAVAQETGLAVREIASRAEQQAREQIETEKTETDQE